MKVQHRAGALADVCCGEQAYLDAVPPVDGPFGNLLYGLDVAEPFFYSEPVRGGRARGGGCLKQAARPEVVRAER